MKQEMRAPGKLQNEMKTFCVLYSVGECTEGAKAPGAISELYF